MGRGRSLRRRYRDESIIASAMDLPLWATVVIGAALAVLGVVLTAIVGIFFPTTNRWATGVGVVILLAYVLAACLIALTERQRRRKRLEQVADRYRLWSLAPLEFEEIATELFRLEGWIVTENKRPDDEDGGVDFEIARKGHTLLVQVKHWRNQDVGVKEVRELWGIVASEEAAGGVVVASSGFTPAALEFAKGKGLELVDGKDFLRRRMVVLGSAGDESIVRDPMVSEGFAAHLSQVGRPACPRCGKPMQLVTTLTDASITRQFWGCSGYPAACQATRPFRTPYAVQTAADQARSR